MARKKQMKQRILALLLLVVLGITSPICVRAADTTEAVITPMTIDARKTLSLSLSSGTATASCKVVGNSGVVTKIVINMYLQKKNSSGVWETYQSWYGTKSSNIYNMTKSCSVSKGTYRVKTRVICYQGSTAETTYHYTTAKTY